VPLVALVWSTLGPTCREGGGAVVEGHCKCGARVSDGDGDEFHPLPVFFEGRDEGVVLLGLLC